MPSARKKNCYTKLIVIIIFFLLTVARMCYDSEAIGADVYIDTSAAKATENIAANVCQCSVQLYNAKQVKLRTTGIASVCGSVIEFKKSNEESLWSNKNCSLYHTATSLTWREDEMMISLHKQQQPYLTDFCVSLYLGITPSSTTQVWPITLFFINEE